MYGLGAFCQECNEILASDVADTMCQILHFLVGLKRAPV